MLIIHYRTVMFQGLFPTLKPLLHRLCTFCRLCAQFFGKAAQAGPRRVENFTVKEAEKFSEQSHGHAADRPVPDDPAERFPCKQIEPKLSVIHRDIHKEREVRGKDHIKEILKKNGAALRTEHCPPDAENVIRRACHRARREEGDEADQLGRESQKHGISLPYLNSLEKTPPPEERFSV